VNVHSYSTDNESRTKVTALLGALSFAVILLGPAYVPALSVLSFALIFALLYGIFNRYVWRWRIVRFPGIVQVPNLSGSWKGYIETSYQGNIPDEAISPEDDFDSEYTRIEATLEITQQWRRINVRLGTDSSLSDSKAATILVNENVWPSLSYQYENNPEPNTPAGMEMHHGTADLELRGNEDIDVLEGVYYTGPGRENHGKMRFTRNEE
jgi:hypothetical protein